MNWRCKLCLHEQQSDPYIVREMMFGFRDTFQYLQCSECECLQIETVPADIQKYYPENYYSFNETSGNKYSGLRGWFRKTAVKATLSKDWLGDLYNFFIPAKQYFVFKKLLIKPDTRILDVGCGNGYKFLFPLAEVGFKNLLGCDPYLNQPIRYPNGLNIVKSEIFQMEGKWDIITFHHSFEHIANPIETIKKVSQLLSDEGVCIIRIPTVSSFAWEKYQTDWVQLDAPRHFFLHSVKSMHLLAAMSDLDLTDVVYDSWNLQFTGSELYVRDIPLRSKQKLSLAGTIKRKFYKLHYDRWSLKLNNEKRGDQAAFFFRRNRRTEPSDKRPVMIQ
jgi:SAM-dependent methyltransferase